MVVIPLKVGTWSIYLMQRSTKLHSVIMLTRRTRKVNAIKKDALKAIFNSHWVMHSLGVTAANFCRSKAERDVVVNDNVVDGANLPENLMT